MPAKVNIRHGGYPDLMIKNALEYEKKIETEHLAHQQRLIENPLSWFALIGRFPLKEGENHFGCQDGLMIQIPQLNNLQSGLLQVASGKVCLQHADPNHITVNGAAPRSDPLCTDIEGDPDLIEAGTVAMQVINRGGMFFLRVWDRESAEVRNFDGLKFYAVNPDFRIRAQFTPYNPPLLRKRYNVIGNEFDQPYAGIANFFAAGKECSLIAEEDEDELLFSFTDETRRDETYPGGRYLVTPKPVDGWVTLDFNLAYNWPCAYTAYATCPLPDPQNHLPVRIEAGEMRYHSDH